MIVPPAISAECSACLARKRPILVESIRSILSERACRFKAGFGPSDVDAVHFEYEWTDFSLVACALNRARGYCGLGIVMTSVNPPFDPEIEERFLASAPDEDEAADVLRLLCEPLFERWFFDAWKEARLVAPGLRGFYSIHDTNYVTDLDSGVKTVVEETGFRFF